MPLSNTSESNKRSYINFQTTQDMYMRLFCNSDIKGLPFNMKPVVSIDEQNNCKYARIELQNEDFGLEFNFKLPPVTNEPEESEPSTSNTIEFEYDHLPETASTEKSDILTLDDNSHEEHTVLAENGNETESNSITNNTKEFDLDVTENINNEETSTTTTTETIESNITEDSLPEKSVTNVSSSTNTENIKNDKTSTTTTTTTSLLTETMESNITTKTEDSLPEETVTNISSSTNTDTIEFNANTMTEESHNEVKTEDENNSDLNTKIESSEINNSTTETHDEISDNQDSVKSNIDMTTTTFISTTVEDRHIPNTRSRSKVEIPKEWIENTSEVTGTIEVVEMDDDDEGEDNESTVNKVEDKKEEYKNEKMNLD